MSLRKKLAQFACWLMGGHNWRHHLNVWPHEDGKRCWFKITRYCETCQKAKLIPFSVDRKYGPDDELALAS